MEGNAVTTPCQATEPAEKGVAGRGVAFVNPSETYRSTRWASRVVGNTWAAGERRTVLRGATAGRGQRGLLFS
jgi:hypothetical protein